MNAPRPPLTRIEGGGGAPAPSPFGPALELAALGFCVALTSTLMARVPRGVGFLGAFQSLYAIAFAFYALALLRLPRYRALPRIRMLVLAVAVAARLVWLLAPPVLSNDLYRYVWEGRVLASGADPWRVAPADPALERLRGFDGQAPGAAIATKVEHPELSSLYPPLAVGGFALVAALSPTVWAMKLWVMLHDLALVLLLCAWCERRTGSALAAIAYAWNPLVIVEYAGAGHHDPTAMVWLAVAFLLAEARPMGSALALAVGAMTKFAPLLALPFLLRRWPWRARVVALATIGAGLAFYRWETGGATSATRAYARLWRGNDFAFEALVRATGSFAAAHALALAIGGGVAVWLGLRVRSSTRATRTLVRTATLLSPVAQPWYLGWVLMFEPLGPSAPWLLLSLTATLNYGAFGRGVADANAGPSLAWRAVEYGLPLALAAGLAWARRARHATTG